MKEISIDDLESIVSSGGKLVDVREPDEYRSGHVPGAVSIPLGQVPDRIADCCTPGHTTYMICRSGARSGNACDFLSDRGHDVVNVVGGTLAWIMSGREIVEGDSPR